MQFEESKILLVFLFCRVGNTYIFFTPFGKKERRKKSSGLLAGGGEGEEETRIHVVRSPTAIASLKCFQNTKEIQFGIGFRRNSRNSNDENSETSLYLTYPCKIGREGVTDTKTASFWSSRLFPRRWVEVSLSHLFRHLRYKYLYLDFDFDICNSRKMEKRISRYSPKITANCSGTKP